ncbi:ABC transporter substrate-binding protein [Desulfosporosinus youngiae]|uniref:ABC-type Fe3+-hydroxamate transport system, periplasmic component n=1 Tax=Desulfosporosinus youngiae DSM 17734 TaxID=768710 RepID=H5XWL5_9FIRM|nr:ABC transporter substrate-binding protein [Desulfosporosinus youngiae]EHQ90523.1 ABC-type Fe3+-hydroxamate transport system, periplasmic component [Desulfosporosinus youngiae DSM 17734]
MNKSIKVISIVLGFLMMFSVVGCNNAPQAANGTADKAAGQESQVVTKVDMAGNSVTLPAKLNKVAITSWMGSFGAVALLGRVDLVSAMADTSRYAWMRHAFPQILSIPDYGSFDKVNVEEMLKSNPDVIISPNSAAEANKKMKSLNMPVYIDGMMTPNSDDVFEGWHKELLGVADLIGETEKAEQYLKYTNDILAMVKQRVDGIPESQRKTALVVRTTMLEVFANNISCGWAVKAAGGINVAAEAGNRYFTTSAENITQWNPDFIFQTIVTTPFDEKMAAYYDEWKADKRYQNIKAIQSGDVYIMPMGVTQWNGDVEMALGVLQMAKIMYPEQFKDIDVKAEAEKFYKTFMNYDLGAEDWKIMAPNFNHAKSNGLS